MDEVGLFCGPAGLADPPRNRALMPEKRFDMVGRKAGWEAQVARGEEEGALRYGRRGTRTAED